MRSKVACLWPTIHQKNHFYSVVGKAAILKEAGYDVWLGLDSRSAALYQVALKEHDVLWTSDVKTACRWLNETAVVAVALGSRAQHGKTLFPYWPRKIFRAFLKVPVRVSLLETPHRWGRERANVVRQICNAAYCPCKEDLARWRARGRSFRKWPLAWGSAFYEPFWTRLPSKQEARQKFNLPASAAVVCLAHRLLPEEHPRAIIRAVRQSGIHILASGVPGGKRRAKTLWEHDPSTRKDPRFHFVPWQADPRPMIAACDFGLVMGSVPYIAVRGFDMMLLLGGKLIIGHVDKRKSAVGRALEKAKAGILVKGTPNDLKAAFAAITNLTDSAFEFGREWNGLHTEQYLALIKKCVAKAR